MKPQPEAHVSPAKSRPAKITDSKKGTRSNRGLDRANLCVLLVIVAATVIVFGQTGRHDFLMFDDRLYVVENPYVQNGLSSASIAWAFTTTRASNWHPLTWLSHMVDGYWYGLNPRGHHLTNVALHALNACLLFIAWRRLLTVANDQDPSAESMSGRDRGFWQAAFVALLFAIHPLRVESVAWVAERKDLLAGMFWMLGLWAYAEYARRPALWRYLCIAVLLVFGLLSKPTVVTLPIVLMILDFWPLARLYRESVRHPTVRNRAIQLVAEKLPLLLLCGAASVATVLAQRAGGAVAKLDILPFSSRLQNALVSYAVYLQDFIWPSRLAIFYPHPYVVGETPPVWRAVAAATFLLVVTCLVSWQVRRRPYLITGWLWYLVTLLPMIGLIQVGTQSHADRYSYLPMIGISVMVAWGVPDLLAALPNRRVVLGAGATVWLSVLAIAAWNQTRYWQSTEALFRHSAAVTRNNYLAHHMLGKVRLEHGDIAGAESEFKIALAMYPAADQRAMMSDLLVASSAALLKRGDVDQAVSCYRRAFETHPDSIEVANNLAWLLATNPRARKKTPDEAIRLALRVCEQTKDKRPELLDTLAAAYASVGRFTEAVNTADKALRVAAATGLSEAIRQIEPRRKLYAAGRPYHEP